MSQISEPIVATDFIVDDSLRHGLYPIHRVKRALREIHRRHNDFLNLWRGRFGRFFGNNFLLLFLRDFLWNRKGCVKRNKFGGLAAAELFPRCFCDFNGLFVMTQLWRKTFRFRALLRITMSFFHLGTFQRTLWGFGLFDWAENNRVDRRFVFGEIKYFANICILKFDARTLFRRWRFFLLTMFITQLPLLGAYFLADMIAFGWRKLFSFTGPWSQSGKSSY